MVVGGIEHGRLLVECRLMLGPTPVCLLQDIVGKYKLSDADKAALEEWKRNH